jgi:hypothetical protein
MSQEKKKVRAEFRKVVFARDRYRCKKCGYQSSLEKVEQELDAHHIINRAKIIDGGYVKENGISLCKIGENCHLKAETNAEGYEEDALFKLIGSSQQKANIFAKKLYEHHKYL